MRHIILWNGLRNVYQCIRPKIPFYMQIPAVITLPGTRWGIGLIRHVTPDEFIRDYTGENSMAREADEK